MRANVLPRVPARNMRTGDTIVAPQASVFPAEELFVLTVLLHTSSSVSSKAIVKNVKL